MSVGSRCRLESRLYGTLRSIHTSTARRRFGVQFRTLWISSDLLSTIRFRCQWLTAVGVFLGFLFLLLLWGGTLLLRLAVGVTILIMILRNDNDTRLWSFFFHCRVLLVAVVQRSAAHDGCINTTSWMVHYNWWTCHKSNRAAAVSEAQII